jgi:SAM-dependent methyltransferase
MSIKQHSNKSDVAVGVKMTPSALHAMMFSRKQASGEYATEAVKCFCGADNYTVVSKVDRYNLNYSLCVCNECGLLYANPRMTKDSYKKFYKEDYRIIYGSFGEDLVYHGGESQTRTDIKEAILSLFNEFEREYPKVVFDIGCGTGSLMQEFHDFDVTGIDFDNEAIQKARGIGLNAICGGIDELEKIGKKADLIIMQHVLEHFLDLEKDLLRIRELISENGVLYIAVPGLYGWNPNALLQNAHTYQFTATTLEYVMHCCGFDALYIDDRIESYWEKMDIKLPKDKKSNEELGYILSHLSNDEKKLLPPMRVNNKFALPERRINMEYTISSGMKEVSSLVGVNKDKPAVVVAGGPTINDYPDKIRDLQKGGAKIFAIERMYQWCLNHDIVPDYIVVLDASDDVIDSFEIIHPDTTHLVLAQCKKDVIDKLKDHKSYFFLCEQKGLNYGNILIEKGFKRVTLISPGGSVGIGAMALAITTGCDKLHIFGFDCHVNNADYANGITGVGCINNKIEAEIKDRIFTTTVPYMSFMKHFFHFYSVAKDLKMLKEVKIYGDSMVKYSSKIDLDGDKRGDL